MFIWLISLLFGGCTLSPTINVVLIDRHSVMESEASGEWPHVEERLQLHKGPIPLRDVNESKKEQRTFKVLNGEFPTQKEKQE